KDADLVGQLHRRCPRVVVVVSMRPDDPILVDEEREALDQQPPRTRRHFDEERNTAEGLASVLRRVARRETQILDTAERRGHFDDQLVHQRASINRTITLLITSTLCSTLAQGLRG